MSKNGTLALPFQTFWVPPVNLGGVDGTSPFRFLYP